MREPVYFLGIDGGGTKTAFALRNEAGETVSSCIRGASNPVDLGIEASEAVLSDGILAVRGEIPFSRIYLFAGIAGAISTGSRAAMEAFFSSFGFAGFSYGSDNENIIAAGLGTGDGITMIVGTGICAFTVRGKEKKRTAGWGYLIDRGGSAYNFGCDAVNAYFSALDGTGPETSLADAVADAAQLPPDAFLGKVYEEGKRYLASFAPLVFREAAKGDPTAKAILERNIRCASDILCTAAALFAVDRKDVLPIVLAGGLTNEPMFLDALEKTAESALRTVLPETECRISVLPCPPVDGALLRARELFEKMNQTESGEAE